MIRAYRVPIKTRCTLSYTSRDYPVTLENISADGALLTLLEGSPAEIKADGLCSLTLGCGSELVSPKNPCKVIRFDSDNRKVAIRFLEPLEDFGEPPPFNHQVRLMDIYTGE